MRKDVVRVIALAGLLAFAEGCASPGSLPAARRPLRYLLVEKKVAELLPGGWRGEGLVDPEATQLAVLPLYAEDLEWELAVRPAALVAEVLGIDPPGPLSPGQTVSVRVRVRDALPECSYRLTLRPGSSPLRMLGPASLIVRGQEQRVFRFTSLESGRVWIQIDVTRLSGSEG